MIFEEIYPRTCSSDQISNPEFCFDLPKTFVGRYKQTTKPNIITFIFMKEKTSLPFFKKKPTHFHEKNNQDSQVQDWVFDGEQVKVRTF